MININDSIQAYIEILSIYTYSVELDKSFDDYKKLDLLSETLLAFKAINKVFPIDTIKIKNINYVNYNTTNDIEKENQSYKNITFTVKDITHNTHTNLIQSYGSFLYYDILEENNKDTTSSMEHLINKLIDIFLNNNYDNLQKYNNIKIDSSTYLYHLSRPKELFGRAFKSYILDNLYKSNYNISPVDFTNEDLSIYKEDMLEVLSLFFKNKLQVSNTIENKKNLINIALNEERRLLKYKNLENNKDEKILTILQENLDIYTNQYNINLQDNFIDKDFVDLDTENINNFKNDINDMNIETIYSLNDSLLTDIEVLREAISNVENEIKVIEGEIVTGKRNKKDLSLENLLRFLFMLSMEHNNKIKMQKALDNSDAACSNEYIYYSEAKEKEKSIINHILSNNKSKSESKLFKVSEIRNSIAKMYGVSLCDLETAIKNMESSKGYGSKSNFIRLRLSDNNQKSKTKETINTNNTSMPQENNAKSKKIKLSKKESTVNKCDYYLNALIKNKIEKKGVGRKLHTKTNSIENTLIKENKSSLSKDVDSILSNLLDEAHQALLEMQLKKEKENENKNEMDLEK